MMGAMVTREWALMMARYNAWQNEGLLRAANGLREGERTRDRGAFWGSIHGTLSHLLWGDHMWLSRFTDLPRPAVPQAESARYEPDWGRLQSRRSEADAALAGWAAGLTEEVLAGAYRWHSGSAGREVAVPMGQVVAHVFNHQTHHRGQVHAMLTAAGARPADTDLFLMPDQGDAR